jgi:hypothetical protein
VIKLRAVQWRRYVTCTEETNTKFWSENLKGRDGFEELFVGGRIILKPIL